MQVRSGTNHGPLRETRGVVDADGCALQRQFLCRACKHGSPRPNAAVAVYGEGHRPVGRCGVNQKLLIGSAFACFFAALGAGNHAVHDGRLREW